MKEILIASSGVILFLIGMIRLSSVVRGVMNVRIKEYVKYAVDRPLYGLVTGTFAAIIFQSSSATTALTIGLVSAGLISFYSSLAIILGADIGTTLTVQFVVWRFTEFSPILVSLGGLLWLARRDKWRKIGEVLFYFGLIFFGLDLISQAAAPLKNSPGFVNFIAQAKNPLFGIGLGMVVTGIVQASAIPIGILALLAQQDIVQLENAVPVMMGANIGTTVTALLVGTVSNIGGKRTAISHLIFKCTGVLVCLLFFPYFLSVIQAIPVSVAQQIALAHVLLNLIIVVLFIFFLRPFAAMMNKLLPGKDEALPLWPEYLDSRDTGNPELALDHVQKELQRQMMVAHKMFGLATSQIKHYPPGGKRDVSYIEMAINNLSSQIVKYLREVSGGNLSPHLSQKLFSFTAMARDIQSMGNHIAAISKLAAGKADRKIKFTQTGEREFEKIILLVGRNLTDALSVSQIYNESKVAGIVRREEEIDVKVKESYSKHLDRFHKRECNAEAGPIFVEMLIHLERISDLCNNIAEYASSIKEDKKHKN